MQNCQFLYLRESFGYNRELFVCPSCVHRVAIGRLRVCIGSILAFYQIRDENRAKLKISYSCGHRVSKSARYDATLRNISFIFYLHVSLNLVNAIINKHSHEKKILISNQDRLYTATQNCRNTTCSRTEQQQILGRRESMPTKGDLMRYVCNTY